MESLSRLAVSNREDDPNQFDLTVASLLVGLDAYRYVDIFKKNNIGQTTLTELSNEDLERLGVDDAQVRTKIIEEVKSLPLYDETVCVQSTYDADILELPGIVQMLKDTSQHLYRMQLSFLANRVALRRTKNIQDCLIYRDLYAADIALKTLDSITHVLDSVEQIVHANVKVAPASNQKRRKMLVGTVGGGVITVLAYLFYKSLKNLWLSAIANNDVIVCT